MTAYGMGVFDQHAAKLASSAIDPEVARERGYVTADTKKGLHRHGFSHAQCEVMRDGAHALVIPLHDVAGNRSGAQMRPDAPRVLKGKPAKYETQSGQKMMLDVPPRVHPHLGDPSRPLFITEGPLKADAMVSAGLDAVALLGVWNWRGTNDDGGKVALADWELVALEGRQVYVVFDSDAMLKQGVHDACARLGAFLRLKKAKVAYVYLPSDERPEDRGRRLPRRRQHGRRPGRPGRTRAAQAPRRTGRRRAGRHVRRRARRTRLSGARRRRRRARPVSWPGRVPEQRDAVALWIVHTYLLDVFDSTPRLASLSPEKQCGKTRVLELVELLARRAELTVSMSAAYMYRAIEELPATLLVDEVDTVFGSKQKDENNEALHGMHQRRVPGRRHRRPHGRRGRRP